MDCKRMLHYCGELDAHNDRDWFHANHKEYELAKEDFRILLGQLRFAVAEGDPDLAQDILYMDPKDWMYRIPRDMRVHKNGPPYQPSFRAYLSRDRRSWQPIGYFLMIAPGISCYGTGLWCESTAATNHVREYIQRNWEELTGLLRENHLALTGNRLKTMPRGFSADHPASEWVRMKNWTCLYDLEDSELGGFDAVSDRVREMTTALAPVRRYLLDAAQGATEERKWD